MLSHVASGVNTVNTVRYSTNVSHLSCVALFGDRGIWVSVLRRPTIAEAGFKDYEAEGTLGVPKTDSTPMCFASLWAARRPIPLEPVYLRR